MSLHIRVCLDDVLALHAALIERWGGAPGVRSSEALQGILQGAFQTFSGTELYPTVVDKAAYFCTEIIRQHPFIDGNKRTALAILGAYLAMHGHVLGADGDELYGVMIALVTRELSDAKFKDYIRAHLR